MCETCTGDFESCQGHFGYLPLALPVYNVGHLSITEEILKCICKVPIIYVKVFLVYSPWILVGFSLSMSTYWFIILHNSIEPIWFNGH